MKTTGFQLREARRNLQTTREVLFKQFQAGLWQFKGQEKPTPQAVAEKIIQVEGKIARVETAQARYNLLVEVSVDGIGNITLAEAVKRVGGAGRLEKVWRGLATGPERDNYSFDDPSSRDPDREYATRSCSVDECISKASAAGRVAGALRAAIAVENATAVEVPNLTPDDLS